MLQKDLFLNFAQILLKLKQMREIMIKRQYVRPQIEVFAATLHQLMGNSFYGNAGEGELDEVTDDAKGTTDLGVEFSFRDVWEV